MNNEQLVAIAKQYLVYKQCYKQSVEMNHSIDRVKYSSRMYGIEKTLNILEVDETIFNDVVHDLEHGLN